MAILLAAMLISGSARFQDSRAYTDGSNRFKITLAGDWLPSTYNDAVGRTKVEFVYRDRVQGLLKIERRSLRGQRLADVVTREFDDLRRSCPACEPGGREAFQAEALAGERLVASYLQGKQLVGTIYYFLQDHDEVWVLIFTGTAVVREGKTFLDNCDRMARGFSPI